MNKFITAAFTAALLTSAAPVAFADDSTSAGADAGVDVSAGVTANDTDVGVDAAAGAATAGTVETTKSATNAGIAGAVDADIDAAINSVTSADNVEIVSWTEASSAADAELKVFEDAMAGDSDVKTIHTKVSSSAALMSALEAEGFEAEDVVSIKTAADGKVKLYVDDRA